MADVALAVHPDDARYRASLGKNVWRPLDRAQRCRSSAMQVIDPEFGTGVLKVTPAHDKVDFEIGQRHSLPVIDVLHPNGRINCPGVPELDGLDRFVARKKAAELLAERGLLGERRAVREQRRLQRARRRADRAAPERAMVSEISAGRGSAGRGRSGEHDSFSSRALGKGLPALAGEHPGLVHQPSALVGPSHSGVVSEARTRKFAGKAIHVGIEPPSDAENWEQDPDVLDTWFSSWLWPFATMGAEPRGRNFIRRPISSPGRTSSSSGSRA